MTDKDRDREVPAGIKIESEKEAQEWVDAQPDRIHSSKGREKQKLTKEDIPTTSEKAALLVDLTVEESLTVEELSELNPSMGPLANPSYIW